MILATEIILLVLVVAASYQTFAHSSPSLKAPTAEMFAVLVAHMRRAQYTAFILALSCLAALVVLEVCK